MTGLYDRYQVTKTNGDPVDARAKYFVLRLDRDGSDQIHIDACRYAASHYASYVIMHGGHLAKLGSDIYKLLEDTK